MTLGMTHHSSRKLQSHQFLYGWQGYLDFIDSRRDVIETAGTKTCREPRYPDGSNYLTWGLFVQDELEVGELLIRAGLRWSYFTTRNMVFNAGSFEPPPQFSRHAVTGSLGLTYRTGQGLVISAHLGQAFRAPNMSDLGKFGESKGLTFEIPNFELNPERSTTLDLQFKVSKPSFRSDISVYCSRIQDLIASVPATWADSQTISIDSMPYKVKRKENIGQAVVYGVESAFDVQLSPTVALEGNLTYTYGHNLTEDDPGGGSRRSLVWRHSPGRGPG